MNRTQVDLNSDGILWLINRSVFHPRGYDLAYDRESGRFWLLGDGDEPWSFARGQEDIALHARIKELMP